MPFKYLPMILFTLSGLALISGCANQSVSEKPSPPVTIQIKEPNNIRFSGKGAGAGVMLSSSMGPMGIAIGTAIDVGIAKDIEKAAQLADFNMNQLLQQSAQNFNRSNPTKINQIELSRYGFITKGGENDRTIAEITMKVTTNDNRSFDLQYPNFIAQEKQKELKSHPLESLKKDGHLSVALLKDALELSFSHLSQLLTAKPSPGQ